MANRFFDYDNRPILRKVVLLGLVSILAFCAGREFLELRNFKETVVVSDSFTKRFLLSDYFAPLKNTRMDTPVYLFDSGVPGGTLLYLGGSHPYEPASALSAYVMMENIKVDKGRVFVIPHANMSASTGGTLCNGYPKFFHVESDFGPVRYRIGDRFTQPLDQWPDPFTYVHYPSAQNLDYTDARNLNRAYPGRPNGNRTEQLAFAIMELTRHENVDLFIDAHEASLSYPVVSTYVSHERAQDIALMASMDLSATSFPMKCEGSPKNLHGLSHREVGDFAEHTLAVLMETPEPFSDYLAGRMTEDLVMEGKDEFLQTASKHKLLFCDYDISFGAPMWYRVGRHLSGTLALLSQMNATDPAREIAFTCPDYKSLKDHGLGHFLHDPKKANPSKVFLN